MPAGCDFVCENEKCQEYKKGIVILHIWPLGDINKVLEAKKVKENPEFHKGLTAMRDNGRTHACITYPNVEKVPIAGYRVQNWCQKCFCIWGWDIMVEETTDPKQASEKFKPALEKEAIPACCPKCNEELKDFNKLIEDKVTCPHCQEKMKAYTWFSNETEDK